MNYTNYIQVRPLLNESGKNCVGKNSTDPANNPCGEKVFERNRTCRLEPCGELEPVTMRITNSFRVYNLQNDTKMD